MNIPKAKLDTKEALELWDREKSEYAKEQVILSCTGIIFMILKKLNIPLDDDMVCTGFVGLVKALNGFKIEKGFEFTTYASKCVANEILMRFRKKQVPILFSLNEELKNYEVDGCQYGDIIADEHQFEHSSEVKLTVRAAIACLSDKERRIICMLYGVGCTQRNQKDVARIFGISQSYVSRLERKILNKMKTRCCFDT